MSLTGKGSKRRLANVIQPFAQIFKFRFKLRSKSRFASFSERGKIGTAFVNGKCDKVKRNRSVMDLQNGSTKYHRRRRVSGRIRGVKDTRRQFAKRFCGFDFYRLAYVAEHSRRAAAGSQSRRNGSRRARLRQ